MNSAYSFVQISDRRLSKIYGVVGWPECHCDSDLSLHILMIFNRLQVVYAISGLTIHYTPCHLLAGVKFSSRYLKYILWKLKTEFLLWHRRQQTVTIQLSAYHNNKSISLIINRSFG